MVFRMQLNTVWECFGRKLATEEAPAFLIEAPEIGASSSDSHI